MKQTETPLQTDNRKIYENKIWVCNRINQHFTIVSPGGGGVNQYIRKDIRLEGQTLILALTTLNNFIQDDPIIGRNRLLINFNKLDGQNNLLPLIYNSKNWNYYKFEGFKRYSLIARVWGGQEEFDVDLFEILIDQSEDIEFYSHPINILY